MSIFEDLIEELKDENLIEETVIEFHKAKEQAAAPEDFKPKITREPQIPASSVNDEPLITPPSIEDIAVPAQKIQIVEESRKMTGSKEYFRKRAMEEVSGLQMVDQVLSGVEREQMKIVSRLYDDLPVKLALHDFLQNEFEANSTEHAQAEFRLMQETENWCSALSHRDKSISISHLRRHCETTRPALSSQALIALARFYRNSPYSDAVRSKFELVVTRLFSRELETNEREILLSREEMILQLKELYADWSSIQLYSSNEEDSEILISMLKFEDFINEAADTQSFADLIASDFFNRLRIFKQNFNENFFSPVLTVASVEANVKIGNRYLELLQKEKEKFSAESLEEKYGFLHDQTISDATGKTFQLAELLHERGQEAKLPPTEIVEVSAKEQKAERVRAPRAKRNRVLAANKWLIAATLLTIFVCGGLYFWADNQEQEIKTSLSVKKVNLESSEFKDFIQNARINEETFFGVTTGNWDSLNGELKEQMLKKLLSIGPDKNFKKIQLFNMEGRAVAYVSTEKVEVYNQ